MSARSCYLREIHIRAISYVQKSVAYVLAAQIAHQGSNVMML
jgi:hypothetical protein